VSKKVRVLVPLIAAFLAVGMMSTSALAASPHFKHGGTPVCTITTSGSSASVTCTASLTGLGNGDLHINVTVSGFAVYQCQNNGGNTAPGQNRVLEGPVTTPTTVPGDQIKNGNVTFTTDPATLTAAPTVTGAEAGCPNPNWTGVNPTLTVTSIELSIEQGGNTFYDCTVANANGLTSPVSFPASC
jgi:hypothetical protein